MNRKDLYKKIRNFRENKLLFSDEAEILKSVINKSNRDDFENIETIILETAAQNSGVAEDITTLAELIFPEFSDKVDVTNFIKRNAKFKVLDLISFEIFEIFNKKSLRGTTKRERDRVNKVYHAIIKVKFEDEIYGFGYNNAQSSISYTIGDSKPFFDNVPKLVEYDESITLISSIIQYTLGVI